jgi:c-di-GMP-binding flagellar brake protein YcgR
MEGITTPEEVMKLTELKDEEQPASTPSLGASTEDIGGRIEEPKIDYSQFTRSRRIYARLNTKVNVSYKVIDPKGKTLKQKNLKEQYSVTQGISAGGLQFISNEAVSLGAILELKIDLPDAGNPIICLAKVLRVELKDENENTVRGFYISVCFLDISGSERARLNKYVVEETS